MAIIKINQIGPVIMAIEKQYALVKVTGLTVGYYIQGLS